MIFNQTIVVLLEFELKVLQRVRFWIKTFILRQILDQVLRSVKIKHLFKKSDFEKTMHRKNHVLIHFTP